MNVILATVKGYNPLTSTEETIYLSDRSAPPVMVGSVPTFFDNRISSITGVNRAMFAKGRISGSSSITGGEITLVNTDGAYDYLDTWGLDGRDIVIEYVDLLEDGTYTVISTFKGTLDIPDITLTSNDSSISLRIKDRYKLLDKKIQTNLFLGTNVGPTGYEGTDNLKDRPKPLCFGKCLNITPVLVNESTLTYQVHDGPINAILKVYDNGVDLGAGFTASLSTGMFTLSAMPAGTITCDVEGAKPSGTYLNNVKSIISEILVTYTDLVTGDLSSDFTSFAPTELVGIYVDSDSTVKDVIDQLTASIGAYCLFDETGSVRIGLVKSVRNDAADWNSSAAVATLEDYSIEEITKYVSADTQVPSYRLELSYAKNYTVQKAADLAGSVLLDLDRTAWLKEEFRLQTYDTPSVQTIYKTSDKFKIISLLVNKSDAINVTQRLSSLYNIKRNFYTIVVPIEEGSVIDLNDVIVIKYDRFDMSAGARFLVVGKADFTPSINQIQLEVWG